MNRFLHRRFPYSHGVGALAMIALCGLASESRAAPADSAESRLRLEYGTFLALDGRTAAAESIFVSILSSRPGDPGALTNLGNLGLLHGEYQLARAFYGEAMKSDSADAGIRLNCAISFLLEGRTPEATAEATSALQRSGGLPGALALLGIRATRLTTDQPKGEGTPFLDEEELIAVLNAAVAAVPEDSARAGTDSLPSPPPPPSRPATQAVWRSAGPRAADQTETATILYWKR